MCEVRSDLLSKLKMNIALEFLDLRRKLKGCNKIAVDVYSKLTNSFTYVDPNTSYHLEIWKKCLKVLL